MFRRPGTKGEVTAQALYYTRHRGGWRSRAKSQVGSQTVQITVKPAICSALFLRLPVNSKLFTWCTNTFWYVFLFFYSHFLCTTMFPWDTRLWLTGFDVWAVLFHRQGRESNVCARTDWLVNTDVKIAYNGVNGHPKDIKLLLTFKWCFTMNLKVKTTFKTSNRLEYK